MYDANAEGVCLDPRSNKKFTPHLVELFSMIACQILKETGILV